jgi:hypothetical protein
MGSLRHDRRLPFIVSDLSDIVLPGFGTAEVQCELA